jgi:hypothetical protein
MKPIEPSSDPVWQERIEQLLPLMWCPMTPRELHKLARKELGWSQNLTSNVLASADGPHVYFYDGKWHRYSHYHHKRPLAEGEGEET